MYDQFVDSMVAAVRKLKIGGGLDSSTTLGPLISAAAVKHVRALYSAAWQRVLCKAQLAPCAPAWRASSCGLPAHP